MTNEDTPSQALPSEEPMVRLRTVPVIILMKVHVKWKAWLYLLLYPFFIYSWIPIVFIGFLHRNEHEWSHTQHTRALSYDELMGKQS